MHPFPACSSHVFCAARRWKDATVKARMKDWRRCIFVFVCSENCCRKLGDDTPLYTFFDERCTWNWITIYSTPILQHYIPRIHVGKTETALGSWLCLNDKRCIKTSKTDAKPLGDGNSMRRCQLWHMTCVMCIIDVSETSGCRARRSCWLLRWSCRPLKQFFGPREGERVSTSSAKGAMIHRDDDSHTYSVRFIEMKHALFKCETDNLYFYLLQHGRTKSMANSQYDLILL